MEVVSMARKSIIRSAEAAISVMPKVEVSSKT